MQPVTAEWLFERGGLHDARLRGVRRNGSAIEIDVDDEWANERGLGRPEGAAPGTLVIADAIVLQGDLSAADGGWISETMLHGNELRLLFCDREVLVFRAASVMWASAT